ncbi:MAG: terpene cyclase/mutase family protein [Verrucomicrobiales bacterium]|nr:terpene cyclase/mutase family protein [Verrucomicrobiales bacterium]MCP5556872.1 terpene cyclase/mutase family protein [Verrucomicrobiaceae bacterium]
MKPLNLTLSLLLAAFACSPRAFAQAATVADPHASLKQEIQLSYKRGLDWLAAKQNAETGQWGTAEPVAFTGLAVSCILLDPSRDPQSPAPAAAEKGAAFLLRNVQPDGGIYVKARANYNTALALMALLMNPKAENEDVMLRARRYLVGAQMDLDEKGKNDNPLDGGIGYGDEKGNHADMSNTHFVLEALHYSEALLADKGDAAKNEPKLNFSAAIDFIQRCQNRPESNKSSWVSTDPKDAGGFVYGPGDTRGEEFKTADGRTALRSYGSISYAGLLSFVYAGLDKSDPRVEAVIKWLSENYTLDENPGLGAQGMYYYYHTMAKGLAAAKVDFLKLKDGTLVDWRKGLAEKLLNVQKGDGSWANDAAGRWMESDPELVTSYVLMALARLYQTM